MKTKHTQGPWKITKFSETGVEDSNGRSVATTGTWSNNQLDALDVRNEQIANAKLIAAAPEMLEALITMANKLKLETTAVMVIAISNATGISTAHIGDMLHQNEKL